MIENRTGDIFAQQDLTHIAHQANLFHTFGSGIAKEISLRFPLAADADKRTQYGSRGKLGTYSMSFSAEGRLFGAVGPAIVNLYCQDGISATHRTTHYAAMGAALLALERELSNLILSAESPVLGLPHGIGCGLAGGDWTVVRAIIDSAFLKSPLKVVICKKEKKIATTEVSV